MKRLFVLILSIGLSALPIKGFSTDFQRSTCRTITLKPRPFVALPKKHGKPCCCAHRNVVGGKLVQMMAFPSHQKDDFFDPRTTVSLIGGQAVLIVVAAVLSIFFRTPNLGLGPGVSFDPSSVQAGFFLAMPLGILAAVLDTVEDRYPALQDVTKATQRSVLGLLGGTFKPLIAFVVALALGLAAGIGEEMLFRGILQYELVSRVGSLSSLLISSLIFGVLHAVTPLYAIMAAIASVYFGLIYIVFNNLAVPIACHAFYDIAALFYAHWTVSRLTDKERVALALWSGPTQKI